MAPLKVFAARIGFFDTVIAAPSQKAALEAWGTRQNLFHDGTAQVPTEPEAIAAALAAPGVLLRRAAGSKAPFVENPAPPGPSMERSGAKTRAAKRPPADRSALNEAEAALRELDETYEPERRELAEKAACLEKRIAELDRDHRRASGILRRALAAAKRDYVRAGGR